MTQNAYQVILGWSGFLQVVVNWKASDLIHLFMLS